ncbi:hypothetical protein H5410_004000 [Solanum commersonii]|uniref:Uncharacterized protein n=1 Tax=Solanum commersonii TaxID=4109 RepID=A0A9J6B6P6_SOLCO|nr:hypothetical protein H5410_004000 [Solanum commersonii]
MHLTQDRKVLSKACNRAECKGKAQRVFKRVSCSSAGRPQKETCIHVCSMGSTIQLIGIDRNRGSNVFAKEQPLSIQEVAIFFRKDQNCFAFKTTGAMSSNIHRKAEI